MKISTYQSHDEIYRLYQTFKYNSLLFKLISDKIFSQAKSQFDNLLIIKNFVVKIIFPKVIKDFQSRF